MAHLPEAGKHMRHFLIGSLIMYMDDQGNAKS